MRIVSPIFTGFFLRPIFTPRSLVGRVDLVSASLCPPGRRTSILWPGFPSAGLLLRVRGSARRAVN